MLIVVSTEVNYFSRLVGRSRECFMSLRISVMCSSHHSTVREGGHAIAVLARKARAPTSATVLRIWWFLHDWARFHTVGSVSNWLDDNNFNHFKHSPGNSSNFNPIENVQAILKYRLRGRHATSSEAYYCSQ